MAKKEKISEYNANILSVVLKKHKASNLNLASYWYNDNSVLNKVLNVLNEIAFYFTLLLNILLLSNYSMMIDRLEGNFNKVGIKILYQNTYRSFLIATIIISLVYIIRKIIKRLNFSKLNLNLHLVNGILALVGGIFAIVTAYNVLVVGNIDSAYAEAVDASVPLVIYLKLILLHILPCLIIIIANILFYIMKKCDFKEIDNGYKTLVERLYKEFSQENPSYSQEEWEYHLNSYDEEIIIEKKKKR